MQIQTKELMQPSAHWRWWHESKIHTFHEVLANYVYRWAWTSFSALPLRHPGIHPAQQFCEPCLPAADDAYQLVDLLVS